MYEERQKEEALRVCELLEEEKHLPEQGTVEWLQWRHNRITASQVPSLLDYDMSALEYCQEFAYRVDGVKVTATPMYESRKQAMKKLRSTTSFHDTRSRQHWMQYHGRMTEKIILRMYFRINAICPFLYTPLKCRTADGMDWLSASPDGLLVGPLRLIEIKSACNRKMHYRTVPYKFYIQMQIQMFVYGMEKCDYVEGHVRLYSCYGDYQTSPSSMKGICYQDKQTGLITRFYENPQLTRMHADTWDDLIGHTDNQLTYFSVEEMNMCTITRNDEFLLAAVEELRELAEFANSPFLSKKA